MQPFIIVRSPGSDQCDEWVQLGVEAQSTGKFPDAERHYRQALRLDPQHAIATQNLGILYAQTSNINEGLLAMERASIFDDSIGVIYANRAFMCLEAERIDEALQVAQEGVKKAPCKEVRLALAMTAATAGLPELALEQYKLIIEEDPKHPVASMNSCFVQTLVKSTPKDLLDSRSKWYNTFRYTGSVKPHHKPQGKPIRVGYVSGDFKSHSAAMIFGNVVLFHDKSVVEPYLYSTLPVDPVADGATKKFQEVAGANWRDISNLNDEQADDLIRKDRIDILVDLAGHTNGGRLSLFTRKPAPIQVTAWGFAHGSGLKEIDYFFACPVSVPEEERKYYAEKIWDLPSIVTYLPPDSYGLKGTSSLPYNRNDYITFVSSARYEKLSTECLETFAEILRRVPDSKIQFKDHGFRRPYSIKRVLSIFKDIDVKRVRFSISTSHPDHMLSYQMADLCLDPWPHSGGVVLLEQLYVGVPVLTLRGTQPSGRTAASVLTAMGRTDWIANTKEEYVEKAVKMSSDFSMLNKVRKTLRDEFMNSSVVKDYRNRVEEAYQKMIEVYNT